MNLDISIQLQDPRWKPLLRPYCKTIETACAEAIASTRLARVKCGWEMAVVLTDDAFIRELNRDYRGRNKPTNVLSFPSEPDIEKNIRSFTKGEKNYAIGDIVLALETVEREAKEQGKRVRDHAVHLLVHGTLHLLGHDHEEEVQAQTMEKLEIKVLKKLGVENPYL